MIISVDIETYVKKKDGFFYPKLDSTKFSLACLRSDELKKQEFFTNKEDLWNRIITLGRKERKRKRVLTVYSHNAQYDFYGYAPLKNSGIKYFSINPFIASYIENGKELVKFLDTLSIFKMDLKSMGKIIGLEKLPMPDKVSNINELKEYLNRDTEIVLKSILFLKERLKSEGVPIKRLCTIHQIAINNLLYNIKKNEVDTKHFFFQPEINKIHYTKYASLIHKAYRGGRVEAFKRGEFRETSYVDCNSLYPYSACNIDFPDLRTEKLTKEPLKYVSSDDLFNNIGIAKALLYNKSDELGILPIRMIHNTYYPKKGKYVLGSWTFLELKKAIENDYELVDIEYCITWQKSINILKKTFIELFNKKKNSKTDFDYYYYKSLLNSSIGKFAQTRTEQEIVVDSVEQANKYLSLKYEIIKGLNLEYMYKRDNINNIRKSYYCPIIPTLINAYARCYMYDKMKLYDFSSLLYTDTDSVLFQNNLPKDIVISKNMGDFKLEHQFEDCIIYGKKTYKIGEKVSISGLHHIKKISTEDFRKGRVESLKMNTIKNSKNINKVGTFFKEKRDLLKQLESSENEEELLKDEFFFIDIDIDDITFFLPKIRDIVR